MHRKMASLAVETSQAFQMPHLAWFLLEVDSEQYRSTSSNGTIKTAMNELCVIKSDRRFFFLVL